MKRIRVNRPARLLLGLACLLTLHACTDHDAASGESLKVYRHAEIGAPANLDPAQAGTTHANFVVVNLFDTLYRYKYLARPYEITPNLALALPEVSDDGLIYTFRIHQGTRFVDDPAFADGRGREVTVRDLVYSLQRHFDPETRSQGAWMWQGRIVGLEEWAAAGANYDRPVPGLVPLDDYTLQVRLTEPYPQLIYTFAHGFSAIVPREAVERYGREFGVRPVGSGPFRLAGFDTTGARLERNPHYREAVFDLDAEGFDAAIHGFAGLERLDGGSYPFVDRIEMAFIEETAARWNSFMSTRGAQNLLVPEERAESVIETLEPLKLAPEYAGRYHALSELEPAFFYIGFNMDDPDVGLSDDPALNVRNRALRCAIRDAFDWNDFNRRFFHGLGKVFPGVIPPMVPEFDTGLERSSVTGDPEGARERLAAAGWTDDNLPALRLGHVASVTHRQRYEQFRAFMQELSFPTDKVISEPFATFGDLNHAMREGRLMIFMGGWGLDYPEAENTLQMFYGPNAAPGANTFNYRNPEFDALFRLARSIPPGPERAGLYRRMNRMVIDDCVAISGMSIKRVHMWHKNVTMIPDRIVVGGFSLRFVDVEP